jgi:thioredoxin reductase (NADPH)
MFRKSFSFVFLLSVVLSGCHTEKGCCDHGEKLTAAGLLKQDSTIKPVVVVGGGVAGLTAANYLLQANIPTLVLEGQKPGGALAQSDSVRNWPGVQNAPGADIARSLKDQAVKNGAQVLAAMVSKIDVMKWPFELTVQDDAGNSKVIKTLSCVVAMGAEPNLLGVPGESGAGSYWGRGVTNCAVCDGALFKGKTVAVVGGGDSAMVEASYLAGIAKKVYVLVRRDVLRANDVRKVEAVKALSNVTFMYNTQVLAVRGDNKVVTHLETVNNSTKAQAKLEVDGMFLAIGATPNTKLLRGQCDLDVAGYVVLSKGQATTVPGLFVAGDMCDPRLKQAVTASAMGAAAAIQTKEFLDERGYSVVAPVPAAEPIVKAPASKHTTKHDEWVPDIASLDHAKQLLSGADKKLMVVDVYGTYCVPCQKMAPVVDALAQYYDHQVFFSKLNVAAQPAGGKPILDADEFAKLVGTDRIMAVPTFLFIKRGKVVHRQAGMLSKEAFTKLIEKFK